MKLKKILDKLDKIFTLVGKFIEGIIRLAVLAVGIGLIFIVAYFLGFSYLQGLHGNDSFNALTLVHWIEKWWPNIPFWYPGQGAGVSFVWGYPLLSSIMIVAISLWQKIDIVSVFKILGFLSLPVSALGIYLFVWLRLKNQTTALISAVFYLLMPISWVWLFDWGFYSEHIAYFFVFPALIFFDCFLEGYIQKKINYQARISLLLAVIFLVLTFASHPVIFFAIIRIIGIYSPFAYFGSKFKYFKESLKNKEKINLLKSGLKNLFLAFLPTFIIFVLSVLAVYFLAGNYQYYKKAGSTGVMMATGLDKEDFVYFNSIPVDSLLGLRRIPQDDFKYTIRNAVVPMLVWAPAIVGSLLAVFISGRLLGLSIAGLISFVFLWKTELAFPLFNLKVPFLAYFGGMRTDVFILKSLVPIIAAFGIWSVPAIILRILTFWKRYIKYRLVSFGIYAFRAIVASVVALAAAVVLIYYFSNKPMVYWQDDGVRYGPYCFNIRDPFWNYLSKDFCWQSSEESTELYNTLSQKEKREGYLTVVCGIIHYRGEFIKICEDYLWTEGEEQAKIFNDWVNKCEQEQENIEKTAFCQLVIKDKKKVLERLAGLLKNKNYWPQVNITNDFKFPYVELDEFNKKYGDDQFLRLDVSPKLGGITQSLNIANKASMINLYTVQLNLLGPYWGYQHQVMYSAYDNRVETMNELVKWFGTRFVLLNPVADTETIDKIKDSSDWQQLEEAEAVWEYKQAPKLWTLTKSKPAVLVIGDLEKRAFEPVFRAANKGALPYDDFWLVQGDEYIDNYSLKELQNFDVLMLFGYKYKGRKKAYRLLENYVKDGGSLFISAGWQYVDADWETEKAPVYFPAEKLSWTDEFKGNNIYDFDKGIIGSSDTSLFGPLSWDNRGWGVSVLSGLKPWAKPILAVDGRPIIAGGDYGKGKVVLSGINLIGHMHSYEYNQSEIEFFRKIFEWLGKPATEDLSETVIANRDYPDKITFSFNQDIEGESIFYFRESFFPAWRAELATSYQLPATSLEIYKAGPGFKLMRLSNIKAGDSLTLEFKPGARNLLLYLISLGTFLGLIIYIIFGDKLYRPALSCLIKHVKKIKKKMKKDWEEE